MGLKEYKRKRDFTATPEPAQGGDAAADGKERIFVVQLHHASRRHYDFRLELDGVLKSWAVPKGPSFDPSVKRLAVEVEDHPISYADFAGDIPKGHYGGGHVDVFDSGTWSPQGSPRNGLRDGDLKFELHGDILRGSWVLVRTRMQGSKQQWLLIKHHDAFANDGEADDFVDAKTDRPRSAKAARETATRLKASATAPVCGKPTKNSERPIGLKRESMTNQAFDPQLCRPQSSAPTGDNWLHEVKWDGYRLLTTIVRGEPRLWSRNGVEWTERLPELVEAVRTLGLKSAQLDGEMVVLRDGRDSFNALQARLSEDGGHDEDDVVYMLFDLLHRDGESWRDVSLIERKSALAKLVDQNPHNNLRYSEHQIGSGAEVFSQATNAGLEGIVSKRIDSRYRGGRSGDWLKVKARPSDEFVVVGFTEPKGSRSGIGALLLGQLRDGVLSYVGRVGSGFDDDLLKSMCTRLSKSTSTSATINVDLLPARDRKSAIWVRPELVVEVFNQGYGGNGLLRQASFKTLRADKTVADLISGVGSMKVSDEKKLSGKSAMKKSDKSSSRPKQCSKSAESKAKSTVKITHPDRIVFKQLNKTKADVADYYQKVAAHLLQDVAGRAISIVRCPGGIGNSCFFQKHAPDALGDHVRSISVREKDGKTIYVGIDDEIGLAELVQMNAIEFHPWGGLAASADLCNRIVFDLDPHPSVAWKRVIAGARELRKQLQSIGLESFVRTSGGKGLHVVVPLDPGAPWTVAKRFAKAVATALTNLHPEEFVAVAGESNRKGKIFIDWLRNGRGATSVASYSLRSRPSAGVAMPLDWKQLGRVNSGDHYTINNAVATIRRRKSDPWQMINSIKQELPELD